MAHKENPKKYTQWSLLTKSAHKPTWKHFLTTQCSYKIWWKMFPEWNHWEDPELTYKSFTYIILATCLLLHEYLLLPQLEAPWLPPHFFLEPLAEYCFLNHEVSLLAGGSFKSYGFCHFCNIQKIYRKNSKNRKMKIFAKGH